MHPGSMQDEIEEEGMDDKPLEPIQNFEEGFMYDFEQFSGHGSFDENDHLYVAADDERVVVLTKWVKKYKVIATYKREYNMISYGG